MFLEAQPHIALHVEDLRVLTGGFILKLKHFVPVLIWFC